MPTRDPRLPLRPALLAAPAYLALSVAATWPLARTFGSRIGGDLGDHWQSLWGFFWLRRALLSGESPFATELLHHPHGISLVHQTFDLPGALLGIALWPLGEVAAFNAVLFFSFAASGLTCFLLARELHASPLAAFFAGCLYSFGPYHLGHALGHLHVLELQWVPLYALGLVRTLRGGGLAAAIIGGLGLAAAATASLYHLLFCFLLTPFFAALVLLDPGAGASLLAAARRPALLLPAARRPALLLPAARRLGLLLALGLLPVLPWLLAIHAAGAAEPWDGAHDPAIFSADLQELFLPNDSQALSRLIGHGPWSGNPAENSDYLGYAALSLTVLAALRRNSARLLLAASLFGILLALGPQLRLGGQLLFDGTMPYDLLVGALPPVAMSGVPVRFGFLATLGLAVGAGLGLDELWRRLGKGRLAVGPVAARLVVAAPVLVALVELFPRPYVTSAFPDVQLLRSWAADPEPWAVLDASGWTRPLWNGTLHGHPQLGGYTTRQPARLNRWLRETPVVRELLGLAPVEGAGPGRAEILGTLRKLGVRRVILAAGAPQAFLLERGAGLGMPRVEAGLWIWEVPR